MTKRKNSPYNKIGDMVKKISEHDRKPCQEEHCSLHMKGSVEEWEKEFIGFNKGVKKIIKSSKDPYEKKIALFELLENLEVGNMPSQKKKRVDYLLKAHLYADLAKQSMEDYKKTTAETFSKAE